MTDHRSDNRLSPPDDRLLRRICAAYDIGIVLFGLGSAALGHIAAGLVIAGIGLAAMASASIVGRTR